MKKLKRPAIYSFILIAILFVIFTMTGEESDENYVTRIEEERVEKRQFMLNNTASPLPDSIKANFTDLSYYPINPDYRVTAVIKKLDVIEPLTLPTSDGKMERYEKFAMAEFRLKGERRSLVLLRPTSFGSPDVIFLAFGDETNGNSTYGGGRYMDVSFKNAKRITLDFNLAYNPYCAYNPTYSCPLPPKENQLKIPIYAGEKNFE